MIVEEHNVEVAFPVYQPLQEIFHSVDGVKQLEAAYLESNVSLPDDESSSALNHCNLRSKSRSE